ncbi:MAG: hypothetical protein GKR87_03580 [Kiritimatiellae bacterium]|nr:hypothetical protein [Kiritimatiellia bacterium]
MQYSIEIRNRFIQKQKTNTLLYTPLKSRGAYEQTRRYTINYSGNKKALKNFVREVLVDEVSEVVSSSLSPAMQNFQFYIDVSLKPGTLNLEKEYILNYYQQLQAPDFELQECTIAQRTYIKSESESGDLLPEPFIRDMVNPVIHTWNIQYGTSRTS